MKTIVWKAEDVTKRRDLHQRIKVTAIEVKTDGTVERIGSKTDTFAGGRQIMLDLLREKEVLPPKAFEVHAISGGRKYWHDSEFQEAGLANLIEL